MPYNSKISHHEANIYIFFGSNGGLLRHRCNSEAVGSGEGTELGFICWNQSQNGPRYRFPAFQGPEMCMIFARQLGGIGSCGHSRVRWAGRACQQGSWRLRKVGFAFLEWCSSGRWSLSIYRIWRSNRRERPCGNSFCCVIWSFV